MARVQLHVHDVDVDDVMVTFKESEGTRWVDIQFGSSPTEKITIFARGLQDWLALIRKLNAQPELEGAEV